MAIPAPNRRDSHPATWPGSGNLDPHHPWSIIHQGYTVLVARGDGSVDGMERAGLWDFDTRILSAHRVRIAGEEPRYIAAGTPEAERWVGHLRVRRSGGDAAGPALPEDTLTLTVDRRVGCAAWRSDSSSATGA